MNRSAHMHNRPGLTQRALFFIGLALLLIAAGLSLADWLGFFEPPQSMLFGESALKTYARIAVIGCAAAAIGSWEPISRQQPSSTHSLRPKSKE